MFSQEYCEIDDSQDPFALILIQPAELEAKIEVVKKYWNSKANFVEEPSSVEVT